MTASKTDDTSEEKSDEQNDSSFQDRFGHPRDMGYAVVLGESINDMRTPHIDAAVDDVATTLSVDCDKDGVTITSTAATPDGKTRQGSLAWVTPAQARRLASALLDAADDWEKWDSENSATPDE